VCHDLVVVYLYEFGEDGLKGSHGHGKDLEKSYKLIRLWKCHEK